MSGDSRSYPGILIAFEGIDGGGKSTQVALLAQKWRSEGREVILTREPTKGVYGQILREAAEKRTRLPADEELELFMKDREAHVDSVILPSLERGHTVITDRYFLSTAAYQGARGLDPAVILDLNESKFPIPNCALILEISVKDGLGRINVRGQQDAFEDEGSLNEVAAVFSRINRDYVARIDATKSVNIVAHSIHEELTSRTGSGQ
jgi:dTMP kinase